MYLLGAIGIALLAGCQSAEEQAQSYNKQGAELLAQGNLPKASLQFRNALKLDEKLTPALYGLGQIEQREGRLDRAAAIFLRAIEQDPQHVKSRVDFASILLLAGKLDDALKYADQAYALAPTDAEVLTLKAGVALKLGNKIEAVQYAQAALIINPKSADANMVLAAERLGSGNPQEALRLTNEGLRSDEKNIGLQLFKLKILEALRDDQEIEKVLIKISEHHPNRPETRYGLVRWYMQSGRKSDAERVLRKFAADDPANVETALAVVEFVRREKGVDAAIAELRARTQDSRTPFALRLALPKLLFATGEQAEALTQTRALVKQAKDQGDRANSTIELAKMLGAKKEFAEAEELISSLLGTDRRNIEALAVRASLRLETGRNVEAIDDLRAALNEAPQSSRLLLLLAGAYERNGAADLAEENFAKAVRIEEFKPDAALKYVDFLMRYGKTAQAERVLAEARAKAPQNKHVLTSLAQLKLRKQDWVSAQEIADALRKTGEQDSAADQILAAALGGQRKFDDSIRLLQNVALGDNNAEGPLTTLIGTYVRAKQLDRAEEFLSSVLKADGSNLRAQVLLGSVHAIKGEAVKAEAAFHRAIEIKPADVSGHRALAEYYTSQNRLPEAEDVLRKALSAQPNNLSLRLQLALVLEKARNYEGAIAEYEQLFSADPRSTLFANNLASLLSEHRTDKESLERAHNIASRLSNSRVPHFLDTVGWIHYRKGDYNRAVTLLKAAADDLPHMGSVQYHLGMAYKQLGQTELAIASFKKAAADQQAHDIQQKATRELEQVIQAHDQKKS